MIRSPHSVRSPLCPSRSKSPFGSIGEKPSARASTQIWGECPWGVCTARHCVKSTAAAFAAERAMPLARDWIAIIEAVFKCWVAFGECVSAWKHLLTS
jgi:hypothetical protein